MLLYIYIFLFFGERLHQFSTLEEIDERLAHKFVSTDDWKHFLSHICCESYPDKDAHKETISVVEEEWPRFHEADTKKWSPSTLGKIPQFIREDVDEQKDFDQEEEIH